MELFEGINQLVDTARASPPDGDPSDLDAERHARFHHQIVFAGVFFTVIGVALGLFASSILANDAQPGKQAKGVLLAPILTGVGGFVFGISMMCMVAPRSFLAGPAGRPWRKLIGTSSVLGTRIACLVLGLAITSPLVGVGLLLAYGIMR